MSTPPYPRTELERAVDTALDYANDPVRLRHEAEQSSRIKAAKKSRAFSGGHRLARMYKFAGEQVRKADTAKSRKKMRKASQRRNRSNG